MSAPLKPANANVSQSLFRRSSQSSTSRAQEAIQHFEGLLWNEVAQAMSSVRLGPSSIGNAGRTYEQMMWRRIAMKDFNGSDQRLTDAIMRQMGISPPNESGGTPAGAGFTGLPGLDNAINRNSATMPQSVEALALSAPPPVSTTTPAVASTSTSTGNPLSWVQDVWGAVKEGAHALGVPAKALLAQAALETGWGSRATGHNLFGVKAHGQENQFTAITHEFIDGVYHQVQAAFASYPSVSHAIKDFVSVLQKNHPSAVGQSTVAGYAHALQASGYATDPRYAAKIEAVASSPRMQDLLRSVEQ